MRVRELMLELIAQAEYHVKQAEQVKDVLSSQKHLGTAEGIIKCTHLLRKIKEQGFDFTLEK